MLNYAVVMSVSIALTALLMGLLMISQDDEPETVIVEGQQFKQQKPYEGKLKTTKSNDGTEFFIVAINDKLKTVFIDSDRGKIYTDIEGSEVLKLNGESIGLALYGDLSNGIAINFNKRKVKLYRNYVGESLTLLEI